MVRLAGRTRFGVGVASASFFGIAAVAEAATRQVIVAPAHADQFVGAAGCKSSSCHGGAGETRSQYITWTQQDFHARAYAVLLNARSARIAETLKLSQAQTSSRCTVCHSPFQSVDSSRLTTSARTDEGVSCESCHNAASSWLRGHTRSDWSYAMRVTAGMRDLRNVYVRANSCVACHQNVDGDILAAGHPELRFELDGQSMAEPKHWRDPVGSGAKAWLIGQAVALREVSSALGNIELPAVDAVAKWNALVWLLSRVTAQEKELPQISAPEAIITRASFIDMQRRADSLARTAAEASLADGFARTALEALTSSDGDFRTSNELRDILFYRAERLVPAVYRLAVAAGMDSEVAPHPENRQLAETVENRASFDPERFSKALSIYAGAITSSPQNGR